MSLPVTTTPDHALERLMPELSISGAESDQAL
jgi:hypothetical protein